MLRSRVSNIGRVASENFNASFELPSTARCSLCRHACCSSKRGQISQCEHQFLHFRHRADSSPSHRRRGLIRRSTAPLCSGQPYPATPLIIHTRQNKGVYATRLVGPDKPPSRPSVASGYDILTKSHLQLRFPASSSPFSQSGMSISHTLGAAGLRRQSRLQKLANAISRRPDAIFASVNISKTHTHVPRRRIGLTDPNHVRHNLHVQLIRNQQDIPQ